MVLKQAAGAIALILVSSLVIAQQPPDAVRVRGMCRFRREARARE